MHSCAAFCLVLLAFTASAQSYTLYSSRWVDLGSKAVRRMPTIIYLDTHRVTIEQNSRMYLDVIARSRQGNSLVYEVLDLNDQKATAVFSWEQMVFDYYAGNYRIRYILDSIRREQEAVEAEEPENSEQPADTVDQADNRIYLTADVMPEFPGGTQAMKAWLSRNARYPAAARKEQIKGLVEVTAVVEKDGSLSDVRVLRDIGGGCGEEAVRVVKAMPHWVPGSIGGEDKRVRVTIRIFFPP
ncbi:MAG: energy transducer TonB [Chitinophagales bacterium]|nr:energy transducer TonB [Chitinophagales bacterium]